MDKHCFNKYFLIPKLSSYIETISKKKSPFGIKASILSNIMDLLNITLIQRNGKINGIRYTSTEFLSIMRFIHMDSDFTAPFMSFPEELQQVVEQYATIEFEKESDFRYYLLANNKQIVKVLKNSEVENASYKSYKKLLSVKEKIEDEMRKKYSSDEALLNLI